MYRAFQHFDTDNSGTISQEELREALRVEFLTASHTPLVYIHISSKNGCMVAQPQLGKG